MTIKDVVKEIRKTHNYPVTGNYWRRIAGMWKRYGGDTMIKAIRAESPKQISLIYFLNIIEKKCQYIIENGGELDEIANELFNSENHD